MTPIRAFSLSDVTNLDDYCTNAFEREVMYLLAFDADRLLAGFRKTAGLDTKGASVYGGWETHLIAGHTLGHYLSAAAQAYANAAITATDRELLYQKITELIDGLLVCQEHSRSKKGFLFAAPILNEDNIEQQFDNIEHNKTNIITEAWVPWYTMHKILAGIISVCQETGYAPALTLAKGLGDWAYDRMLTWDAATHRQVLNVEYGGMNDALYDLYLLTGEERYATVAHAFDDVDLFERITSGDANTLNNHHANTTIPKFIGAIKRYIANPAGDTEKYLQYAEKFWDLVVERHTYITGANSEWEHFGVDYILDAERTNCNNETCNVYNMLKLSRYLFEVTGKKKYADYYENAFYNSILSSQNPLTGMTTYFQPMATGYFKVYSNPWDSFWCCTGSGMENFTKLNDSLFFHDDNSVYVNLYASSKLTWKEKNLMLSLEAQLPESNRVLLTLTTTDNRPTACSILLRLPEWLAGNAILCINGETFAYETRNGYALLPSGLPGNSTVELVLPMKVTAHPLKDNPASVGFMYGPVVLSADLGTENMTVTTTGMNVTIPETRVTGYDSIALPDGCDAAQFCDNADSFFVRDMDADMLVFTLKGTGLTFTTHYRQYQDRYGIYFYLKTKEELEAEHLAGKDGQTVMDTVQPGYGQYENDELHQLNDLGSVGVTNDGTYRYAIAGGSFSYRMAVSPAETNVLSMTLRTADNGKTLRITSGETVLFSDVLNNDSSAEEYELRIELPSAVTKNALRVSANERTYDVIPLTFSGVDGAESARVCSFIYTIAVRIGS